jgi:hypothetical protein
LLIAASAFWLLPLSGARAQTGLVAPYLQSATPTSIVIMWETNTNPESIVEYGLTETLGSSQSGTAMTTLGNTQLHTVTLSGLAPGTRYFYKARTGSWQSGVYDFETPPLRTSEAPLNMVLMSDMQKDGGNPTIFQNLVNNSLLPYVEANYGTPLSDKVQMAVLPGDLVDVGSNYLQWKNDFFNPAEALWRSVPIYPAIGNHEGNSPNYFNYFTLPDNGTPGYLEHWYYTDYSNVRVISCNTNGGYRIQAQLDWLESVLDASYADTLIDFVFAQMHHPYLSELWIAGNTDYTGQIIDRLEAFSADCGKPSVHFFGHTHAYSRGQSRDHEHLWINVATSGGNIDYWGEFANQDYAEYIISTDDYGFVMVEVQAGANPQFVMKRLSFGDQYNPGGSTITDSLVIRINNAAPDTPYPLFPTPADTVSPLCTTLKADGFSDPDGDGFGAAQWQVATDSTGFGTPIRESWKQYANWYNEVDTQAGDDLTDETFEDLPAGLVLWWRVRYRDKGLGWSAWSAPVRFHTHPMDTLSGNLVLNSGAENGTADWTTETGNFTTLLAQECTSGTDPHTGSRFFVPGVNTSCADVTYGAAYQDIDITAYAAAIGTGNVAAHFGAYLTAWGNNNDEPSIALAFLDENGTLIGTSDTLDHRLPGWTLKSGLATLPPVTRTVRFRLMGTRLAGTDNDSYIDDVFLQLITAPSGCSTYTPPGPAMGRIYVDEDAPAYPDGKSWTTAYRSLRDALAQSNADTTVQAIWIAEGVYPVTTSADRSLSFSITRDVAVYGGFAGTEELLAQRDIALHPVVLSGEIGDTSMLADNSWHVVTISHTADTVRLDGLTITGGYADDPGQQRGGALTNAISAKEPVVLDGCTLTGNYGLQTGSVFNQSKLVLDGCTITQSEAAGMSQVVLRNEGSTARLVLANTTLTQSGTGATQGLENVGGAEVRVMGNTTLEKSE